MSKKLPLVIEKKLGRQKAAGQAFEDENKIEIDPRLTSKEYFFTLIHEQLHLLFPDWSEAEVSKIEKKIGNFLWKQNYRKVKL